VNVAAFQKQETNYKDWNICLATNHLGPFILTNELLDLLKAGKPSRVVTVSAPSTTKINFDDINGNKSFLQDFWELLVLSKMMNIMFTYALARRLEGTSVTASVFHPGLVKSNLTKDMPKLLYYIFKTVSSAPDKPAKMLCSLAIERSMKLNEHS